MHFRFRFSRNLFQDLGFWKSRQATVVFYFQGGVGSFDGVLYPVIMTAKYFDQTIYSVEENSDSCVPPMFRTLNLTEPIFTRVFSSVIYTRVFSSVMNVAQ